MGVCSLVRRKFRLFGRLVANRTVFGRSEFISHVPTEEWLMAYPPSDLPACRLSRERTPECFKIPFLGGQLVGMFNLRMLPQIGFPREYTSVRAEDARPAAPGRLLVSSLMLDPKLADVWLVSFICSSYPLSQLMVNFICTKDSKFGKLARRVRNSFQELGTLR